MKQEASAILSRLEWWYGMTFWTKLQHDLLCFVCAEDEMILRETVKEGILVIKPWCDKCMYNLFSTTLIQVFPYSANISDMKWWYANDVIESNNTEITCFWWGGYLRVTNFNMEEKPLIIADAIQIEETLFFRHSITNVLNTFHQRCNTWIGNI